MSEAVAMPRPKSRMFKNLVVLYGSQMITGILSLAPIAFIPQYLDPASLGRLIVAGAFAGILTKLIMLGTGAFIVREIARDHGRLSELLSSTVVLRTALAVLLLPVTVLLLYLFNYPQETNTIVLIMYGALTIRMISTTFAEGLQAIENMTWRSAASIAQEFVAVAVGWIVLWLGGGLIGYVLVLAFSDVVSFVAHASYFVLRTRIRPIVRISTMVQVFRGGMPFFLWAFIQTVYFHTSSLMLSKLGGETATGYLGIANQFMTPLFMLPSVAITVLLPRFSQLSVLDTDDLRTAVTRAMSYMTIVTMPMAFGVAAVAGQIMDLFNYPPEYAPSVPVLRVMAFMLPGTSLLMIAATTLTAMNKERGWARVSIFSLVAAVALNGALIPVGRSMGNAALGAAAAFLSVELLTYVWALRLIGSKVFDVRVLVTFAKTTLAAATMAAAVAAAYIVPLFLVIPLGAIVYVALVLLLGIVPAEDLSAVRTMIEHRWSGSVPLFARLSRGR